MRTFFGHQRFDVLDFRLAPPDRFDESSFNTTKHLLLAKSKKNGIKSMKIFADGYFVFFKIFQEMSNSHLLSHLAQRKHFETSGCRLHIE